MSPTSNVLLEFDPDAASLGNGKPLSDGLSVAAQLGKTLWVANDETLSLERLTLAPGAGLAARALGHVSFPLADYLDLPVPPSTCLSHPRPPPTNGKKRTWKAWPTWTEFSG